MAEPLRLTPTPFDEAILTTRARGVVLPDVYYGHLQGIARADSFSIAGLARVEQIQQALVSLTEALESGETFDAWRARVRRGDVDLDLPDYRLENIYRTNLQGAYARGRCRQHDVIAERRPWLLYSAVNDSRTRPAHAAMDGTLLHRDDPWWQTHRPPNGYQCRCTAIAVSNAEAERRGAPKAPKPDEQTGDTPAPDPGWDYDVCGNPRAGAKRAMRRARAKSRPQVAERLDRIETVADANDPATWRELPDSQRGGNPGGIYEAPDGSKHYVKFYADPAQARTEIAAARIYERLGVQTLKPATAEIGGRTAVATRWVDGLSRIDADALSAQDITDLADAYVAAVLTKTPGIAGVDLDNIMRHPNGRLTVIDTGGAFGEPFGADIDDVVDPAGRPTNAIKRAAAQLERIDRAEIERLLTVGGLADADVARIGEIIEARRLALMESLR